jgi:succinate dehydrogenase/fumarate reductase cytochrome b subunit
MVDMVNLIYTVINHIMKKLFTTRGIAITSFIFVSLLTTATAADINTGITNLSTIVSTLTNTLVKSLGTLFATAAMVAFFFGVVQYIWGAREGDEAKIKKGNIFMKWSMLALFIMFSLWGIIIYVQKIFGIDGQSTIIIPSIQLETDGGSPLRPVTSPVNGSPLQPVTTGGLDSHGCSAAFPWNEARGQCVAK